jgi:hypothetical protein
MLPVLCRAVVCGPQLLPAPPDGPPLGDALGAYATQGEEIHVPSADLQAPHLHGTPSRSRPHVCSQHHPDQLCQMEAGIARAHGLSQALLAMVRERRGHDLEAWMAEATDHGIEELASCARRLRDDLGAVTTGLTLAWSNGVTEGQIHRLKLLKCQSYGRAGFALLRQRILSNRRRSR